MQTNNQIPTANQWLFSEGLRFGATNSHIGIIALWTELKEYDHIPSNLYRVMGNLYSQGTRKEGSLGVAAIARNILANPYIRVLIICGEDTSGSKAALLNWQIADEILEKETAALSWLKDNVRLVECEKGELLANVLKYSKYSYEPSHSQTFPFPEKVTADIVPSELSGMRVMGLSIDEAWRKALAHVLRFGVAKNTLYGDYRELLNLVTVIDGQRQNNHFSKDSGERYLKEWRDSNLPTGLSYTYPNRIYKHFGVDQLHAAVDKLKRDPGARSALISLWDTQLDNIVKSVPCLTEIQLHLTNNTLHLRATFRSHDIVDAYPLNLYALRDLQKRVCRGQGWRIGTLTVFSGSAHVYDYNLDIAKKEAETRKMCEWDRRGNVVVTSRPTAGGMLLIAILQTKRGVFLKEYTGETPSLVIEKMAFDDCLSQSSHWAWVALELSRVYQKINGH